jgi:chromosome segregation ATPase
MNNGNRDTHHPTSIQHTSLTGDANAFSVSQHSQECAGFQNLQCPEEQLHKLQADLDALTSVHFEAVSARTALSVQLQKLQEVEKQLLQELKHAKAEAEANLQQQLSLVRQAAEVQLTQALHSAEHQYAQTVKQAVDSVESKSAFALQQAEERQQELVRRVTELEGDVESMSLLKAETEAERLRWREMAGDLSASLESKVSDLELAISQAKAQVSVND